VYLARQDGSERRLLDAVRQLCVNFRAASVDRSRVIVALGTRM
jgi:hypothetical protein